MPLLTDTATRPDAVRGALEVVAPVTSRAEWTRSFSLEDHAVPTGREEAWRFTPLRRLRGALEPAPTGSNALAIDVKAPALVKVGTLREGQFPRGEALVPEDRAAAGASVHTPEALHLHLPDNTHLNVPVVVTLTGSGPDARSNHHVVIEAGAASQGTIILRHQGSAIHVGNVEVICGRDSEIDVISVHEWNTDAVHLGQHEALVGPHATYRHMVLTWGGDVVRVNANVRYEGPGGSATLLGAYLAGGGQHIEHRSYVDHNTPDCTSDVLYKGALREPGARTVWIGDVLIRAAATGTQTYELNRNLVLCDGAQADSVPNLEIETGEIRGAGHASATGRFDEQHLFYLMARGIPEDVARRLVVRGFFAEVVQRIPDAALAEEIMASIQGLLGHEPEQVED